MRHPHIYQHMRVSNAGGLTCWLRNIALAIAAVMAIYGLAIALMDHLSD